MLMRIQAGLREISASTTIVAMYGSIDRNWLAICTPDALQVELQHRHAAEKVGAEQHTRRSPGGERRQRERDPAAPAVSPSTHSGA